MTLQGSAWWLVLVVALAGCSAGIGGSKAGDLRIPTGQALSGCINTVDNKYSVMVPQTLIALGGTPFSGYTWTLSSRSAFPAGTTVAALTGVFNATNGSALHKAGTQSFDMTVSDGSTTATGTFTLRVSTTSPSNSASPGCPTAVLQQRLDIATNVLPDAKTGAGYGASLFVMGGEPPYAWSRATGDLPPGLTMGPTDGVVRGTPLSSAAGHTYSFTVKVTDAAGDIAACSPCPTQMITVK
ncbi:MAG: Ig domain-containing protein [Candidatus Thermoplasmatota archaeon]